MALAPDALELLGQVIELKADDIARPDLASKVTQLKARRDQVAEKWAAKLRECTRLRFQTIRSLA